MLWVPIPIPIFEVAVFMLSLSTYDVFTDGPHVIPGSIPPTTGMVCWGLIVALQVSKVIAKLYN
jgi:hypothetical protein